MKYVRFYCGLRTPLDEDIDARQELLAFRSEISELLQLLSCKLSFAIHWNDPVVEEDDLWKVPVSEPFPASAYMQIDFEFSYLGFEHAVLRVEMLKSLLQNVCYKQGVFPAFASYLDDVEI